jgi:hypothetical protein
MTTGTHTATVTTADAKGKKTYTVTLADGRSWERVSSRDYKWVVVMDSAAAWGTKIETDVMFTSREPRLTAPKFDIVNRPVVGYFRVPIA